MQKAYIFPGQGSQSVGMGQGLFSEYSNYTEQADKILGYSIEHLCLKDSGNQLGQTNFTQPAIYTVSVLSYLKHCEENAAPPDCLAGHSLGEYSALYVAGCFDFATGLKIVCERSRLMSESIGGGMAAITNLDASQVADLLKGDSQFSEVEIANLNTPKQTVVSGNKQQILKLSDPISALGGGFYPLNVSGAFHSRYMSGVKDKLNQFLNTIKFNAPKIPVISNVSAKPYPMDRESIKETLIAQITAPVNWVESIYYMKAAGVQTFEEIGPGHILSRMNEHILPSAPKPVPRVERQENASVNVSKNQNVIFLCPGQGGQYFGMGRKLYDTDACFREHFQRCDGLAKDLTGESIRSIAFEPDNQDGAFTRTLHTHIANFSFGVSAGRALQNRGVEPSAYIAWSLGEYIALALSGGLKLEDAMLLVAKQAMLVENETEKTSSLLVKENVNIFYSINKMFSETSLIGIHSHNAFVVTGVGSVIDALGYGLKQKGIESHSVPVEHGFHTGLMDSIEGPFKEACKNMAHNLPETPIYSCASYNIVSDIDEAYLWNICRGRFNFFSTLKRAVEKCPDAKYYDIGPSGTSAGFTSEIIGRSHTVNHALAVLQ